MIRPWTAWEDALVLSGNFSTAELMEMTGRSKGSVNGRRYRLSNPDRYQQYLQRTRIGPRASEDYRRRGPNPLREEVRGDAAPLPSMFAGVKRYPVEGEL
ncbi:MAG: hypothetical protein AAFR55_01525 [Pseudomonadota bacterium]